jgi:hypothetical protein
MVLILVFVTGHLAVSSQSNFEVQQSIWAGTFVIGNVSNKSAGLILL